MTKYKEISSSQNRSAQWPVIISSVIINTGIAAVLWKYTAVLLLVSQAVSLQ